MVLKISAHAEYYFKVNGGGIVCTLLNDFNYSLFDCTVFEKQAICLCKNWTYCEFWFNCFKIENHPPYQWQICTSYWQKIGGKFLWGVFWWNSLYFIWQSHITALHILFNAISVQLRWKMKVPYCATALCKKKCFRPTIQSCWAAWLLYRYSRNLQVLEGRTHFLFW